MQLNEIRKKLNMGIPLSNIPLRVTDYARVSTEQERQLNSLKNQVEHFDEMIKNNPHWEYVNGYVDEGITGTSTIKRDAFMKMLNDAKKGNFDLIITKEISRFSRNTLDSIKYTRELLEYGVAVLFVNDNINTALPDAELRLTIMASMAQDEIRRLSERVKFGMHEAIKKGHILGNNLLYGYRKDKETNRLYIIEEESKVVKRLFTLYGIENYSLNKITMIFNDEGIKTIGNKKWCVATLSRMLKNPKYKGYYCGKKSEVIDYMSKKVSKFNEKDWIMYKDIDLIPPIIDESLWNLVNEKLSKKVRNKVIEKKIYPLSSKIYCANDLSLFHRRITCQNDVTWLCSNYLKYGKKKCSSPNIRESEIYSIFRKVLEYLDIDLKEVIKILSSLYDSSLNDDNKLLIIKEKILKKKEKLLELSIDGSLSNNEFKVLNDKYNNELEKLKVNLECKQEHEDINVENNIKDLVYSDKVFWKIIDLLLEKIDVKSTNDNIEMKMYFSNNYFNKSKVPFYQEIFKFQRGFKVKCTKRYIVQYEVTCFVIE